MKVKMINIMKKFEYNQVEYRKFPSTTELNKEGVEGWELVEIHQEEKRFYDEDIAYLYTEKIYKATFKREV